MNRMLRPASSEQAGPTPRLWKKKLPKSLLGHSATASQYKGLLANETARQG